MARVVIGLSLLLAAAFVGAGVGVLDWPRALGLLFLTALVLPGGLLALPEIERWIVQRRHRTR